MFKEIVLPRYYEVHCPITEDGERMISFVQASQYAADISYYHGSASVTRDPLVKNGEQIQGEHSVSHFIKGKRVFP